MDVLELVDANENGHASEEGAEAASEPLAGRARSMHHAPRVRGTVTRRKTFRGETACPLNKGERERFSANRVNAKYHFRMRVAKLRGCEGALVGCSRSDRERQRTGESDKGCLEPSEHICVRA